ncbi:MAG: Arylsulfatase, partial [Verrucomicrobiota bacterium]
MLWTISRTSATPTPTGNYFTHQRDSHTDWYRNGEPLQEPGYTTHLVADEACRLIETG